MNTFVGIQRTVAAERQSLSDSQRQSIAAQQERTSFTVVSSNTQQITLQDNANQQRFTLPANAFSEQARAHQTSSQQLPAQALPKQGDTLVILSATDRNIRFRLIPAAQASALNPNQAISSPKASVNNTTLPLALNQRLVNTWPDISMSGVSKVGLNVVAQTSLPLNSQNAGALSSVLTQNAIKFGQPVIELALSGKIIDIQNATASRPITQIQVALNLENGQKLSLTLPVPKPLSGNISGQTPEQISEQALSKFKVGANVDMLLTPTGKKASILAVQIQNSTKFDNANLAIANELNPKLKQQLKQVSENSLLQLNQASNRVAHSSQNILIHSLQKNIVNALPQSLSNSVASSLNTKQIDDARLVILPNSGINTNQAIKQNESNNVQLLVVAKPQLLNVSTTGLTNQHQIQLLRHSLDAATAGAQMANTAQVDNTLIPSNPVGKVPSANAVLNVGELLNKAQQKFGAQAIPLVNAKLKSALQHTLVHAEPSAPIIKEIKQSIDFQLKTAGEDTKALLQPLAKQLELMLGNNKATPNIESDNTLADIPSLLRSAMSAHAVTSLVQSPQIGSQNNLIEGLVSVLKMNLMTKLAHSAQSAGSNPQLKAADIPVSVAALANTILKQHKPNNERINAARVIQDLATGDARGNLIAQIGKLLSSHNSHKLRSAEASLQGQDTFYYSFPNLLNAHHEDIEVMIKRESEANHDDSQSNGIVTTWRLNMKLDIGKDGEVLAKTKIALNPQSDKASQNIDLHLYASTEALKNKVLKHLPALQKRLHSLGITVNSPRCDIGKADPALFKTQLEVMNAYA